MAMATTTQTIPGVAKRLHRYIAEWDDERSIGNSLIVTLVNGRAFTPSTEATYAEHVRGFDTVAEAMRAVRAARPCHCPACA